MAPLLRIWHKTQLTFTMMRRMIAILFRLAPVQMTLMAVCEMAIALLPIMQIFITVALVNAVQKLVTAGGAFRPALWILLAQFALLFLQTALELLGQYGASRVKLRMMLYLGSEVSGKSARISLLQFENHHYYDLQQRIAFGLEHRGLQFFNSAIRIVQALVTLIGMFVVLARFHPLLAVGLLALIVPSLIIDIKESGFKFNQDVRQTPTKRKAAYFSSLLSHREWAKEIRIFGLTAYFLTQWNKLYRQNGQEQLVLERHMAILKLSFSAIVLAVFALLGGLLLKLAAMGRLGVAAFIAILQTLVTVQSNLKSMSAHMAGIYELALYTQDLFRYLEMDEESESHGEQPFPVPLNEGIHVENLTFRYPHTDQLVLKNISFRVNPGEKIAIVGENGAGKSTLVKCLLGLYPLSSGSVAYDGVPIREINPDALRDNVAAIFQDFVQYQLSLRDNIGFGSIHHGDDEARLQMAAASSGIDALADELPQGYDTELGYQFMGGHELSFGQWQKIAISRAFYRNAQLIVLDEPTSALDPLAEAALFQRIATLTAGKTTFFISHRLGICRAADRILVLRDGELIEQGSHEDLMDASGEYERMFRTQAEWYR